MDFNNKNVLVCGIARSGISASLLLRKQGANVTLSDIKERDKLEKDFGELLQNLENNNISLFLGKNPDEIINNFDLIVISPGLPIDLPFLNKARELKIEIWGEVELSYRLCKSPIVAITGTNGKTTTTTLVGQIFSNSFGQNNCFVVGNIGIPFSEKVLSAKEDKYVIAEISSFQMETSIEFKPHISAVLNITPDHLNRHKTLECYIQTKERIFANQDENDFCVLNFDDKYCNDMRNRTKAKVLFFSQKENLKQGVFVKDNNIYVRYNDIDEYLLNINELKVFGNHIIEDVICSVAIGVCAGIDLNIIRKTLIDFTAVEHRIEFVRTLDGIDFYNDSKATNTDAGIKAIEAMTKPIILIGGGQNKDSDYSDWVKSFGDKVKHLVLIGETADQIIDVCKAYNFMNYEKVSSLKDAVDVCFGKAKDGDCVLLSPACASLDMFDDYEQRGNVFKDFVHGLGGKNGKG